ncbi:DNA cytosine methyltransferase [Nitrosovibrio sp. Nv6]|uniref:DNA cytosine methyltransferase n=1 Tax=Nitrosovibrio sp. Nv6 TaxID=1855340 RepID=UPI0008B84624|nr:DNA cytosine methyltransferase [Nitrosovibrio sp. Nv6]SEO88445.1 DNA (cytosine-5)-methyltransferase 1 [Nitrosovibrio sp. Nv6]
MDKVTKPLRFLDVFAGCGGLSLGLLQAGCQGVFAIEKNDHAFETLHHNLVDGKRYQFDWPKWLPRKAMACEELLRNYGPELDAMKDNIDLIVGSPPCQGFSTAGQRDPNDPRNKMTEQYLLLVEKLQPRYLAIENVAGFNIRFEAEEGLNRSFNASKRSSYADHIAGRLVDLGYSVSRGLVNCADFGVPQNRVRYLMLCERDHTQDVARTSLFQNLINYRSEFLKRKNLPSTRKISVKEAIGDLLVTGKKLVDNTDSGVKGFKEAEYQPPVTLDCYLSLMRMYAPPAAPNSRRLAKHLLATVRYFEKVQEVCRPGICMSVAERKKLGTKKHSTTLLHGDWPAPTITTLPDDIVHYSEPRILTVRENARLQSFPDWFEFKGSYTTGGKQRKHQCPRYTQVGNAVPPLLANAIGEILNTLCSSELSIDELATRSSGDLTNMEAEKSSLFAVV